MAKTQNVLKTKISEPQLILELKELFEQGKTGKTDLLVLLSTKYKLGRNRYFKIFDTAIHEWQQIKNKVTSDSIESNQKEVLKAALLTKIDRILIAEEIAIGKPKKIGTQVIIISPTERLRALDYLAKINADYAPTKIDIDGTVKITNPNERESRIAQLIAKAQK